MIRLLAVLVLAGCFVGSPTEPACVPTIDVAITFDTTAVSDSVFTTDSITYGACS